MIVLNLYRTTIFNSKKSLKNNIKGLETTKLK